MTATIFNIQRFSLFDGPGVRTVVFFKGCPLRCMWCHNPEGLSSARQIMYNPERCIGCGACIEACDFDCHAIKDGIHTYDRHHCISCGKCAEVCYSRALTTVGQVVTVDEIMETVLKDKAVYLESGGGLTLSGGEPLLQGEFAIALLKSVKSHGLHTCVETSGFGKTEILADMAKYVDLFLFDYKITGDDAHRELCGVPQTPILEHLTLLNTLGAKVILRCPLLPFNRNADHAEGIARTVLSHSCIVEVQIMPYHRLGIAKAAQLGMPLSYQGETEDHALAEAFVRNVQERCGGRIEVSIG
ncbi:MAG: glycyl-radical enzyme activating protein [Clostridia bacterium]|nr:glycyl-radical enzyme activating protein [Clostridia bacterium]